jgi:hypothetical protein
MSEIEDNVQEIKWKTSKWAKGSIFSAFIALALIILLSVSIEKLINGSAEYVIGILFGAGFIFIVLGVIAGIVGLVRIKVGKGKLRGKGFAISGVIISLILIMPFSFFSFFYMAFNEKPYDDSNGEAIMAKVEKFSGIEFPEKVKSLKAAEKITAALDTSYAFVVRFVTDQNGFNEFRNSLSKAEGYSEERTDELVENGKSYTYHSRGIDVWGSRWRRNAPEWYDLEIPKGKVHELLLGFNYFICVELADSKDVIVNAEGFILLRHLEKIAPEEFNNLMKKWNFKYRTRNNE